MDIQLPLQLAPFDIAAILLRTKGDIVLAHKLILMFHANYANACTELDQYLAENRYQEAASLVHTLKGAAMMLEVQELPAVAAALEQAIENQDQDKIALYLQVLESVLTPAIQAAASLQSANSS